MSVNLYDYAYNLEKALRQSDEYTKLKKLYDQVNADPAAQQLFENFRNLQIELQQKQMMGQEISQQEVEEAQKTVAIVQQHPTISQLMQAEQHMNTLFMDLNKIITKPLEELYGIPNAQ
jgi:cell fate (sporulation/competence/biofilm development) regulator YlbF (YheA/YmcA/DUF963 family)